jgi:hypothetical protein
MQILYLNKILTAVLSSSSEDSKYSLVNVQDRMTLKLFHTLNVINEWIKIASIITASRFAIINHNLSSAAIIKLQGNNTDIWTTPAFEETIAWKEGIIIHKFTEVTYDYWRLLITDNARTYISIGELYIGTYLQGPNIKPDTQIDDETTSEGDTTNAGMLLGDDGYDFRPININYPNITNSQREAMRNWWRVCKNNRAYIMVLWANREDLEPPIYCFTNQKSIQWKRTGNEKFPWSTSIKYQECR